MARSTAWRPPRCAISVMAATPAWHHDYRDAEIRARQRHRRSPRCYQVRQASPDRTKRFRAAMLTGTGTAGVPAGILRAPRRQRHQSSADPRPSSAENSVAPTPTQSNIPPSDDLTTPMLQSAQSVFKRGLALVALVAAPSALYAQSCAMCYQNAAAAGPRTAEALRHGILVMLFPPLFIFAGIIVLAHRRRDDTTDMDLQRRIRRFRRSPTRFDDPSGSS